MKSHSADTRHCRLRNALDDLPMPNSRGYLELVSYPSFPSEFLEACQDDSKKELLTVSDLCQIRRPNISRQQT